MSPIKKASKAGKALVKTTTSRGKNARCAVTGHGRTYHRTRIAKLGIHSEKKTTRIDVRAKIRQKEYLIYAASLLDMDLTSFVLSSAVKEAEKVISENIEFLLEKEQWDAFCDALDQPPRTIPKLRKLFAKKSIFKE